MDDDLPLQLAAEERAAQPLRRYERESKLFAGIGLLLGAAFSIALATRWLPWFLAHNRDFGVRDLLDVTGPYLAVLLVIVPAVVGGTLGVVFARQRYMRAANVDGLSEDGTPTTAWREVVRATVEVLFGRRGTRGLF